MKKFLATTFIFLSVMLSIQISYATEYSIFWRSSVQIPNYWHDDKNYPLVFAHSGSAWYLDKNSIKVEVNDPPYYIISANTVFLLLDSKLSYYDHSPNTPERDNLNAFRFFYNEEEHDMRLDRKSDKWKLFFGSSEMKEHDWIYLFPPLNWGLSGYRPVCVGEAVFYVAQGRKFYGDFLWEDIFFESGVKYVGTNYKPQYIDIFRDGFYETLE